MAVTLTTDAKNQSVDSPTWKRRVTSRNSSTGPGHRQFTASDRLRGRRGSARPPGAASKYTGGPLVHSVLAILAGFAAMAVIVMITTALAMHFILRLPAATLRAPGPGTLSPAYLATNVAASGLAAVVGGYTAAAIAGHDGVAHGLGLAAVMLVMSVVSMRQAGSAQPRWYRVVLATVMPGLAVVGAALCGVVAAAD